MAFGEVSFHPASLLTEKMIEQAERLSFGKNLITNLTVTKNSEELKKLIAEYQQTIDQLKAAPDKTSKALFEEIIKEDKNLRLRISKGHEILPSRYVNDMILLMCVCKQLLGQPLHNFEPNAKGVKPQADGQSQLLMPGQREIKPGEIKIRKIRLDKLRYDEDELARATIDMRNLSSSLFTGKVLVSLEYDLNQSRSITEIPISVKAGENLKKTFSFNTGSETYGRGLKAELYNKSGDLIDVWREYFPVAKEWFRVQQHLWGPEDPRDAYFNQEHRFALEPTDYGVHDTSASVYLSGQVQYKVNTKAKKDRYSYIDELGMKGTIYQTSSFCGQMGYEEARKHPEFLMYDSNGQFAVDPIYGSYPNPMELDSPIDIGPTRKVEHWFLDRKLTSWQHVNINFANQDAITYAAKKIKDFSKKMVFDGVYFDGNLGVQKGYNYSGNLNVPSDKTEDYIKLNTRNHKLWAEILQADDPYFGLWFNWSYGAIEYYVRQRGMKNYLGSGIVAGNDTIKAVTESKNTMFLMEWQTHQFTSGTAAKPIDCFNMFLENRDWITQQYGANTIVGYVFFPIKNKKNGGLNKWAWTTINHLSAQIIAGQTRLAGGFLPSLRPMTQFTTRYSRFIWAPDLKLLKSPEKTVQVHTDSKIWWKNSVYKITGKESDYLVINLVTVPAMEKWDFDWLETPDKITDTKVILTEEFARSSTVMALRPYDFDEPQQIVEKQLQTKTDNSSISFTIPPFRYYMMIVCKIKK